MTKHHAKEFGRVRSDETHSVGGMKFWKKLYNEKDPEYTFHHEIDHGTQENHKYEERPIDDEYMKNNENNIWNSDLLTQEQSQNNRIVIREKE